METEKSMRNGGCKGKNKNVDRISMRTLPYMTKSFVPSGTDFWKDTSTLVSYKNVFMRNVARMKKKNGEPTIKNISDTIEELSFSVHSFFSFFLSSQTSKNKKKRMNPSYS